MSHMTTKLTYQVNVSTIVTSNSFFTLSEDMWSMFPDCKCYEVYDKHYPDKTIWCFKTAFCAN